MPERVGYRGVELMASGARLLVSVGGVDEIEALLIPEIELLTLQLHDSARLADDLYR